MSSDVVGVTGAAGFIGSHLVDELLETGLTVKALVHYNALSATGMLEPGSPGSLEVVFGDIQDPFQVDSFVRDCNVVFHLAALIGIPYSYLAPQQYVSTNVTDTLNVLEACRKHATPRLVHVSTSEVYGNAVYTPMDEKHPTRTQSPYAATKLSADKLVESYHLSFDLPVVTLRPFNNYGPRQSARAVIPTIVTQALNRSVIELGDITAVRDYVFVKDAVQAFLLAAHCERAIGEVINLGTGRSYSIGEIAQLILDVMGIRKDIRTTQRRVRPSRSEITELCCDPSLAASLLGWKAARPISDGLDETVEWIRHNLDIYPPHSYIV